MSYVVPTLTQIRDRIEADFNTRLPGADSRLARGILRALSFAYATAAWSMYQFLGWISRQRLPDTAEDEELDRLAGVYGLSRSASAAAAGSVTVVGINGAPINAGAALQTLDGITYAVQADAEIVAGTATLLVRASQPGSAGNQTPGTTLAFVSPVAGVGTNATVVELLGGLDEEGNASFRGRLLDHLRRPPQGGADGDYVKWARSVAGVTRAWERPDWQGAGTVGVLFVFDDRELILPLVDDVTAMQALLNRKRPITTTVYAVAPTANAVPLTIALNPSSDLLKAAVEAELDDLFAREGVPGATIPRSHITDAVGLATGDGDYRVEVPAGAIVNDAAEITTRGAITWAAW